jgi:pimeloyl-ACP methyl ester carboxylesterase
MACLAPRDLSRLALVDAAGLWLDDHPIPDIFSLLPFQFADLLFHDPERGAALLTGGVDFGDLEALRDFYIGNARRMGMAGKILFPIPDRHVARRLYRLSAPTLVAWGASDRLIPPIYARRWAALIPHAEVVTIEGAGHMLPYEQPEAFTAALTHFLG